MLVVHPWSSVQEIEQGEQEDPDDVHKVPVQPAGFQTDRRLGGERPRRITRSMTPRIASPMIDVQGVQPGHDVVQAEVQDLPLGLRQQRRRLRVDAPRRTCAPTRSTCSPGTRAPAGWSARQQECREPLPPLPQRGDRHGHGQAARQQDDGVHGADERVQLHGREMELLRDGGTGRRRRR